MSRVRLPAAALSGNDLGQVLRANVPLFSKQYNLVPCEGFHVSALVCGSQWHASNEQGSIVVAVLQRSNSLRTAILIIYFTVFNGFWLTCDK